MRKGDFAKWFFEGVLIVFSVLMALVINETVDQSKLENEKGCLALAVDQKLHCHWSHSVVA